MNKITTVLALGFLVGCIDSPPVTTGENNTNNVNNVNNSNNMNNTNLVTNNGTTGFCPENALEVLLPSGEKACTFQKEIVIETGFECPPVVVNRFDFQSFAACDSRTELPPDDIDHLNVIDASIFDMATIAVPETNELDLIWILDNSASMCQEQFALIDSIPAFLGEIIDKGVKLRVGVTTTHTADDYLPEPLARGGHFQSTPQPVPGFDQSCWYGANPNGTLNQDDLTPIRRMLDLAVGCMATPAPVAYAWTDEEIRCGLNGFPQGCVPSTPQELFPDPSLYRQLPLIFDTENYLNGGTYDTQQMAADLGCMALVGTRGYGIERGLEALTLATSSTLLNGANQGLLRPDARFGVFILTDEDDCTGNVDVKTSCGGDACEFAKTDSRFGTLVDVEDVRDEVVANLTSHKGRPVSIREVLVASLHGQPGQPATIPVAECERDTTYVTPSCTSPFGTAYYGERYEAFLRTWSHGNYYPYSPNANVAMDGMLCQDDLSGPVERVAEFFTGHVIP